MQKNRAVFLDRDGTINADKGGYVHKIPDFDFIPGVVDALARLSKTDFKIIIVTNQSGVARGFYTDEQVELLHDHMLKKLQDAGCRIDAVYYCPHHPDEACACRKPGIGMVKFAEEKFNLDLSNSYMIGDRPTDTEMAKNAGIFALEIEVGKEKAKVLPDKYVKDTVEAIEYIIKTNS